MIFFVLSQRYKDLGLRTFYKWIGRGKKELISYPLFPSISAMIMKIHVNIHNKQCLLSVFSYIVFVYIPSRALHTYPFVRIYIMFTTRVRMYTHFNTFIYTYFLNTIIKKKFDYPILRVSFRNFHRVFLLLLVVLLLLLLLLVADAPVRQANRMLRSLFGWVEF